MSKSFPLSIDALQHLCGVSLLPWGTRLLQDLNQASQYILVWEESNGAAIVLYKNYMGKSGDCIGLLPPVPRHLEALHLPIHLLPWILGEEENV